MTIPTQMNCEHSPDGWCLKCVNKMVSELARISSINYHASEEKQQAYQAGRDAMREEAMKVCLKWHHSLASEPEMLDIANEIGELK